MLKFSNQRPFHGQLAFYQLRRLEVMVLAFVLAQLLVLVAQPLILRPLVVQPLALDGSKLTMKFYRVALIIKEIINISVFNFII